MMALARGPEPRFMLVSSVPPSRDRSARIKLVDRRVMVRDPGFEPGSLRLRRSAFTRLAYRANWSGQRVSIPRPDIGNVGFFH